MNYKFDKKNFKQLSKLFPNPDQADLFSSIKKFNWPDCDCGSLIGRMGDGGGG